MDLLGSDGVLFVLLPVLPVLLVLVGVLPCGWLSFIPVDEGPVIPSLFFKDEVLVLLSSPLLLLPLFLWVELLPNIEVKVFLMLDLLNGEPAFPCLLEPEEEELGILRFLT